MKIYTRLVLDIETGLVVDSDHFEYLGPVALCCGATDEQKSLEMQQSNQYTTMVQQAQQVFGASSQVFQQLQSTFAPIVAAGPSQQGFSPAELSNLKSGAITSTGQAYKNAKGAVGNAEAAEGGGNNAALQTGTNTGTDIDLASDAASKTADSLGQINEANYQTGRQNFDEAAKELSGAPNVFNPATSSEGAATSAGNAASNSADKVAQENQSWVQSVTGALGGIASKAISAYTGGMGGAGGSGGSGGSYNAPGGVSGQFQDED